MAILNSIEYLFYIIILKLLLSEKDKIKKIILHKYFIDISTYCDDVAAV